MAEQEKLKSGDVVVLKSDLENEVKMTYGGSDMSNNAICFYVAPDPLERIKRIAISPSALRVIN